VAGEKILEGAFFLWKSDFAVNWENVEKAYFFVWRGNSKCMIFF